MAEAIRSSVTAWNWVTVQWPGSYRGFPRGVSLGTGVARVGQRSWVLVLCVRCVQHVWRCPGEEYQENCAFPAVEHGGASFMVWGCMITAGTGELRFIEGNMDSNMYFDTLKQKMMPSLKKLFSNITTTPNTPPRWQMSCCWRWRWWSGRVCLQTWTLLSTCGASSSRRWRSTMCLTSSSSVMSLWRSGRGCQQQPVQLWWIPCPGGLKRC